MITYPKPYVIASAGAGWASGLMLWNIGKIAWGVYTSMAIYYREGG